MLAATITAVLLYLSVQRSGTSALSAACWDERLSRAGRNGSCVAAQPFLIFGHGKAIHRMDLDGKNHRRLVSGVGSSILLDFHFREETVYWADRKTGVIHKLAVTGARRQRLYSADKHISGLAVDWIGNSVYWTSAEKGKVKTIDKNGKNERTLVRHLIQPSSITVDPTHSFLFWLSTGTSSSIQRSDITGRVKTTLIKTEQDLKALTIDRAGQRLFWVQFGSLGENAIASSDYSGHGLRIQEQPLQSRTVGISIFLEHLYYNDAALKAIKQINKYTGVEVVSVNTKPMAKPPVQIKVVHDLNQPMANSQTSGQAGCDNYSENCVDVCSGLSEQGVCQCSTGFTLSRHGTHCEDINECAFWNHGCSLGCENIPGSYFCTCPGGYALLPDRKTCQEIIPCDGNATNCGHGCLMTDDGPVCVCPDGSVLQDKGDGCTGCSSEDRGGCSQLCTPVTPTRWQCGCLPGYHLHQDSKRCTASGPLAFLLVANLVEVRQIHPDGSGDETLVEEPRGSILALDYDPVQKHVYFASQRTIERMDFHGGSREVLLSEGLDTPEGLAIDWVHRRMYWTDMSQSTVECSSLAGLNRQTILSQGLDKPRGVAVHPLAKKLFWTDVGVQPSVEGASLEGDERIAIANSDLLSPSGLAIDFTEERLFWCDQRRGVVESAALDGSHRQVVLDKHVGRPFGIAVFEDRIWISDQEQQQLMSVHKRTRKTLQLIRDKMVQPASIAVVHPLTKPGADVCLHLNGGCAHICKTELGFAHCSCLPHHILSADGASCLPAGGRIQITEAGGDLATDLTPVKNKTFNKESRSQMSSGPPTEGTDTDEDFGAGSESDLFTDKMVSDQHDCSSLHCDVNAQCLLSAGTLSCRCLAGFTGDGQVCVEMDTMTTTNQFADTTSRHNSTSTSTSTSSTVQSCPSSHESYCLYEGVCFYYPDIESYACVCMAGYTGERCQLSDLEWWDLQQSEEEKRRNKVIAACMVVLVSLLSIVACLTYCYGAKNFFRKHPSVDNVSETSVTDESVSESTSGPQTYKAGENGVGGIFIPILGVPAKSVSSSSASESGENQSPDDCESPSKHRSGYERSAYLLDTTNIHHCSLPAYTLSTFTSFKPRLHSESPGEELLTSSSTTEIQ